MNDSIDLDWTVEQVLLTYPFTADVFVQYKTSCVGCRLAKFCSLEDAGRSYDLVREDLLAALKEALPSVSQRSE